LIDLRFFGQRHVDLIWHFRAIHHQQKSAQGRFFCWGQGQAHIQYTRMYKPSHTTSTKCQYQAAPSKPK
jgi:dTDP-4-dehydrorhamnose 3,5-epimerase-like enzyme